MCKASEPAWHKGWSVTDNAGALSRSPGLPYIGSLCPFSSCRMWYYSHLYWFTPAMFSRGLPLVDWKNITKRCLEVMHYSSLLQPLRNDCLIPDLEVQEPHLLSVRWERLWCDTSAHLEIGG